MFKKINLFLVIAALAGFVVQSAQAVISDGEVWRKQRSDGTYQMIYCLGDIHIAYASICLFKQGCAESIGRRIFKGLAKISQEQKRQLYDVLSNVPKDETMVLVEDMPLDKNGSAMLPEQLIENASKTDFLPMLMQDCMSRDIPVINLECRQNKGMMAEYIGLKDEGEIVNVPDLSPSDLEAETDVAIQEIKDYRSGPFLNIYNTKELAKHNTLRNNFIEEVNKTGNYDPLGACSRDVSLLDMKAINYIHASDKKHIVLAMGAAHIQNIVAVLPALGYEKICESGCITEDIDRLRLAGSALDKNIEIIDKLFGQARTFDVAKFIGDSQSLCMSNTVFSKICKWFTLVEPKPVHGLDPDRLLVSMVSKYPTRFPFCLLLPKVAKYLTEEEQLKKASTVDNSSLIQSITQEIKL